MKKFLIIILLVLALTSCGVQVDPIVGTPPEGYSKGYYIRTEAHPEDLQKFIDQFATEQDTVVYVTSYKCLILRK